jgi:hypothetical protein
MHCLYNNHLQKGLNRIHMEYLGCISRIIVCKWHSDARANLKQDYTEWQGNSPLAGMAIALRIVQCLLHWPPCQRRTALWFSPWTLPGHPWSLVSYFFQKLHYSAVTCPSYSSFVLTLFLALHRMFLWQYIGPRWASKIWICCWIYFQIRTMLSGGIPLTLPF